MGDRPEVVSALVYLGLAAYRENDLTRAWDLFSRAERAAPEGPQAGRALAWMALIRESRPDGAMEAETLYQRALRLQDPNSAEAATTMDLYARFLRQQNRIADADAIAAQSRQIRQARISQPLPSLAPNSTAYRVGGGVSAPMLLHKVEPAYTEEARAAKYQGTVLLSVEIGPDGVARNIRIVRSLGLGLDEKAIEAISQWLFKPGMKDGQPVTVAATIEVNFRLM